MQKISINAYEGELTKFVGNIGAHLKFSLNGIWMSFGTFFFLIKSIIKCSIFLSSCMYRSNQTVNIMKKRV